ncbi:copper homeostasis protein CutC [Rhizobium sp.]|jgi:copper homeostasis protein|uniref:copper homeostasis protein CutC n=1 Tax=Rhizobium sp. TaxID=391 RepID=UPI000E9F1B83|nr:copper homeostasis protein CutC [Rhizobium sp.]
MVRQVENVGPLLEVCVDDVAGMQAAIAGGADRIELCTALACGGLTPPMGLMELASEAPIPVFAMIRPRSGSFVFSRDEIRLMIADITAARRARLAGVVLGASLIDGRLDCDVLRQLVEAADGMDLTLHRAFDLVPDQLTALVEAQSLGFRRILTSGGQMTAREGLDALKQLVSASQGRTSIMPGGGVSVDNLSDFATFGMVEFHASCSSLATPVPRLVRFGFELEMRRMTDERRVRSMKNRILQIFAR